MDGTGAAPLARTICLALCTFKFGKQGAIFIHAAGTNRPMSPSYAIAARQAKERALDGDGQPAMVSETVVVGHMHPKLARGTILMRSCRFWASR